MPEEISDDRFKSEVMRLLSTAITKIDGFEQRFDGMEQQFGDLENRFGGLEKRFDGLEKRFNGLEKQFDGLERKVDGLERKMDSNTNEIKILSGQFADVVNTVIKDNQRITKLEKEVEDLQSNIH